MSDQHRPTTLALLLVLVSVFLIGGGAMFFLAESDNDRRDREDREYADCLTEFAADLVATIETRNEATIRLERVSDEKDEALDRLLRITELARRTPPEATAAQFDAALALRVAAQARYDEVAEKVADIRAENQYVSPKVVCSR